MEIPTSDCRATTATTESESKPDTTPLAAASLATGKTSTQEPHILTFRLTFDPGDLGSLDSIVHQLTNGNPQMYHRIKKWELVHPRGPTDDDQSRNKRHCSKATRDAIDERIKNFDMSRVLSPVDPDYE